MNTLKIIYWISTVALSAFILMGVGMYFFNTNEVAGEFTKLGYPTYLIYPLAFAKLAAVIVFLIPKKSQLKEWAYSALFFELLLAFLAHIMTSDGQHFGAVIAILLLLVSYYTYRKTH